MANDNFFITPNNMGFEYSFPQINFSGMVLPQFNINSCFCPEQKTDLSSGNNANNTCANNSFYTNIPIFNFPAPSFFDFPPMPQFTLPPVDLSFNMQPLYYQPASITPAPIASPKEEKVDEAKIDEVKDNSAKTETVQESVSQDFKPKTKKVKLGKNVKVKLEEIKPGYYICKQSHVDIQNLKPGMKEALVKMNEKAKELGYDLVVSSGFRSHENQKKLKKERPKYAADPYKSAHEYGVAIDICFYKNGEKVTVDKVPVFAHYAESLGLTWGGRWKNQYEPWHFNLNGWTDLAEVRDEYRRLNGLA